MLAEVLHVGHRDNHNDLLEREKQGRAIRNKHPHDVR